MDITITSVAERPELRDLVWEMPDSWPEFLDHDLVAEALFGAVASEYLDLALVATDDTDGSIVAHGTAVAFRLDTDGRQSLPDTGWDQALVWASRDLRRGVEPDVANALEVSVRPDVQGQGLSSRMIAAMRDAARARGLETLVACVRPSHKHLEPSMSMTDYVARTNDDGLPADPWLRVHVRVGGVIERIAPASQTVGASLSQWREWTGEAFDQDGATFVPDGLGPAHASVADDHAVYIEPNVWVRHDLTS